MIGKCGCDGGHGHIVSLKLAVIALTLLVLNLWDAAMDWVRMTNVWVFVILLVIFIVYPIVAHSKGGFSTSKVKKKKKKK